MVSLCKNKKPAELESHQRARISSGVTLAQPNTPRRHDVHVMVVMTMSQTSHKLYNSGKRQAGQNKFAL
jgi:hypothetical protein